jgi:hypothetical protein
LLLVKRRRRRESNDKLDVISTRLWISRLKNSPSAEQPIAGYDQGTNLRTMQD